MFPCEYHKVSFVILYKLFDIVFVFVQLKKIFKKKFRRAKYIKKYRKYPQELLDVMPYYSYYNKYGTIYYWTEQLYPELNQYSTFFRPKKKLRKKFKSWLDDKKKTFDSVMEFAKQYEPKDSYFNS